eukprot:14462010-Alexandrium_andersonii.AAC.1
MAWGGAPPAVRSWPWPVQPTLRRSVRNPRSPASCPCARGGLGPRSPRWKGPAFGAGPRLP